MLAVGQDLAPCTVHVALQCCGTQGLPAVFGMWTSGPRGLCIRYSLALVQKAVGLCACSVGVLWATGQGKGDAWGPGDRSPATLRAKPRMAFCSLAEPGLPDAG